MGVGIDEDDGRRGGIWDGEEHAVDVVVGGDGGGEGDRADGGEEHRSGCLGRGVGGDE